MQKRFLSGKYLLALVLVLNPVSGFAWYQAPFMNHYYPASGYYSPYQIGDGIYPYYAAPGWLKGSYLGYTRPRMYMRGYIDRDGQFRLDVKLRNISWYDMYNAWLIFQEYGYR